MNPNLAESSFNHFDSVLVHYHPECLSYLARANYKTMFQIGNSTGRFMESRMNKCFFHLLISLFDKYRPNDVFHRIL